MTDTIPPYPGEDEPEWEHPQQPRRQQAPRVGIYVAIWLCAALALVLFIVIVVLVSKQRAEAGNPANGLQGNNSPYAFYAFFIGIVGFAVIATIVQHWVINPGGTLNWPALGISTLVFAVILGVLITIFAKHQSYTGSVTSAPPSSSQPPASSSRSTTVKLKCDPNIGGSFCQAGGNGDNLALDILGVPNIYDLCNSGYSLHFTDNRGQNLDDISGTGCFTITGGVDTSMLLDNGSGIPYVAFYPPTSSSTGNTLCGRWVIKLRIEDPSGSMIHTARYRTTVGC
jgi:hypothetical protein